MHTKLKQNEKNFQLLLSTEGFLWTNIFAYLRVHRYESPLRLTSATYRKTWGLNGILLATIDRSQNAFSYLLGAIFAPIVF